MQNITPGNTATEQNMRKEYENLFTDSRGIRVTGSPFLIFYSWFFEFFLAPFFPFFSSLLDERTRLNRMEGVGENVMWHDVGTWDEM